MSERTKRVVVAMTGASAMAYGLRLLDVLAREKTGVDLMLSANARELCRVELGKELEALLKEIYGCDVSEGESFGKARGGGSLLTFHAPDDFGAAAASGSGRDHPMVVVPCSMGTLGRIAAGLSDNLLTRSADVCLKERRPLILVPRETPLSVIHLENMLTLTRAGAIILPPCPGFYQGGDSVEQLVDFIVQRIINHLGLDITLQPAWGESS